MQHTPPKTKYSENILLITDMQEIFVSLNSHAFPVSSVARTQVSGIFSCLSNFLIPYLRVNSILKNICVSYFKQQALEKWCHDH